MYTSLDLLQAQVSTKKFAQENAQILRLKCAEPEGGSTGVPKTKQQGAQRHEVSWLYQVCMYAGEQTINASFLAVCLLAMAADTNF